MKRRPLTYSLFFQVYDFKSNLKMTFLFRKKSLSKSVECVFGWIS